MKNIKSLQSKMQKIQSEIKSERKKCIESIGRKIKSERKKRSLTQGDVAMNLGVTRTMICNIEKGDNWITTPSLIALCLYFEVSADYILGMKD
jgi:transcriptional regulator with XRE-family HTH domain